MENEIEDTLNNYFEKIVVLLKKFNFNFSIKGKIRHQANFLFEEGMFHNNFNVISKIIRSDEVGMLKISDSEFRNLSNLNETLSELFNKDNHKVCSKHLEFNFEYKNFNNSYVKGNKLNPVIVDDFINNEIKKLRFNFYEEVENWDGSNGNHVRNTLVYFSSSDNKLTDLKNINYLNEYASTKYEKMRLMFILPSGVLERKFMYNGINLNEDEDTFDNSNEIKSLSFLQDYFNYNINSYENELSKMHEESEIEEEFQVNFFNSIKHKLTDQFECYFLDRRNFLNEKYEFFEEGKTYLINSEGVMTNSIRNQDDDYFSKLNRIEEVNRKNQKFRMTFIEKSIKIITNFKHQSTSSVKYSHEYTFQIAKEEVKLIKNYVPLIMYNSDSDPDDIARNLKSQFHKNKIEIKESKEKSSTEKTDLLPELDKYIQLEGLSLFDYNEKRNIVVKDNYDLPLPVRSDGLSSTLVILFWNPFTYSSFREYLYYIDVLTNLNDSTDPIVFCSIAYTADKFSCAKFIMNTHSFKKSLRLCSNCIIVEESKYYRSYGLDKIPSSKLMIINQQGEILYKTLDVQSALDKLFNS